MTGAGVADRADVRTLRDVDARALAELAGRPVVVGSGLAGLMTALELAPTPCVLVTAGTLDSECASAWAQGGLAAAIGADDSPALHTADTLAAGAGLVDERVAARITAAGPSVVDRLVGLGTELDRDGAGALRLGLEGAHSRRRIVHADGDGTGRELVRAAVAAVRASAHVTVLERTRAQRLLLPGSPGGPVTGIVLAGAGRSSAGAVTLTLPTSRVVLATGGVGGLFAHTTNPLGSWGSGLALGLRAGAQVRDLELVQFHPTALDVGLDPMPLVSEAVRGEGARLVDETGADVVSDPLGPRDVVARAVWAHLAAGYRVLLDTPTALGDTFPARFPAITAACRAAGLDPAREPLPVRPAAHYHMGGLVVGDTGRTTVRGLWAVGEVASTGLHGANRLASNSLLEAAACATWVAADVAAAPARLGPCPTHRGVDAPTRPGQSGPAREAGEVRTLLGAAAGGLRDHGGLSRAIARLWPAIDDSDPHLVALALCWSALQRRESRGGHARSDHPDLGRPVHVVTTLPAIRTDLAGALTERSA